MKVSSVEAMVNRRLIGRDRNLEQFIIQRKSLDKGARPYHKAQVPMVVASAPRMGGVERRLTLASDGDH
jgi:hypothetical protein